MANSGELNKTQKYFDKNSLSEKTSITCLNKKYSDRFAYYKKLNVQTG